jgi:hypothetical protein
MCCWRTRGWAGRIRVGEAKDRLLVCRLRSFETPALCGEKWRYFPHLATQAVRLSAQSSLHFTRGNGLPLWVSSQVSRQSAAARSQRSSQVSGFLSGSLLPPLSPLPAPALAPAPAAPAPAPVPPPPAAEASRDSNDEARTRANTRQPDRVSKGRFMGAPSIRVPRTILPSFAPVGDVR